MANTNHFDPELLTATCTTRPRRKGPAPLRGAAGPARDRWREDAAATIELYFERERDRPQGEVPDSPVAEPVEASLVVRDESRHQRPRLTRRALVDELVTLDGDVPYLLLSRVGLEIVETILGNAEKWQRSHLPRWSEAKLRARLVTVALHYLDLAVVLGEVEPDALVTDPDALRVNLDDAALRWRHRLEKRRYRAARQCCAAAP